MVLLTPKIGQWYLNRSGTAFEVVALDNDGSAIEIQFVDGTVDELDDEGWVRTTMEEIEPPNDCMASLIEAGESDIIQTEFVPRNEWLDTLDFMDLEYVEIDEQLDLH